MANFNSITSELKKMGKNYKFWAAIAGLTAFGLAKKAGQCEGASYVVETVESQIKDSDRSNKD